MPSTAQSVSNAEVMIKSLIWSAALVLSSSPAWAGEPRLHDGLYVRAGAGLGLVNDSFETEDIGVLGTVNGTITGLTIPLELSVGTSLKPGLIVGGGMFFHYVPSPAADNAESSLGLEGDVEFDPGSFILFGPLVDFYFDPRQGLHLQGSVGLGYFSIGEGDVPDAPLPTTTASASGLGFGAMVGFGNEWWVTDDWSIGVLARLAFGVTGAETEDGVESDHSVWTPSLLFTATLN